MNDKIKQAAKAIVTEIMNDMKRMFSQTGNILPSGYFLIYHEAEANEESVMAVPIPNIVNCFETREAEERLQDYINHASYSFTLSLKKPSEKIIGVAIINDAFCYDLPPGTDVDVSNALLPEFHPNRKEAIVGMLYFKDAAHIFNYPYLRAETRIIFEKQIIEQVRNLEGTQENLYPYNYAD